MKPRDIYVLRHGLSEGNKDWRVYTRMEDADIPLAHEGEEQAIIAGMQLAAALKSDPVALYTSDYLRARQTTFHIDKRVNATVRITDNDLRELFWSPKSGVIDAAKQLKERELMGQFDYSNPGGESARQVCDRMKRFIKRMEKDWENPNFPKNQVIVSHGIAIRCLFKEMFGWSDETYPTLRNPRNCQIFHMFVNKDDKYELIAPFPLKDANDKKWE